MLSDLVALLLVAFHFAYRLDKTTSALFLSQLTLNLNDPA